MPRGGIEVLASALVMTWLEWLSDAVGEIVRTEDPASFRHWLDSEGAARAAELLGEHREPARVRALATALAPAVWNAAPLPGHGFRPAPLPLPERNDPCPCGGGAKFKKCCGAQPIALPPLDPIDLWIVLIDRLDSDGLDALAASRRLPPSALAEAAERLFEVGGPEPVAALLAPFLTRDETLDESFEVVFAPLVRAALASPDDGPAARLLAQLEATLPPARAGALWRFKAELFSRHGNLAAASQALRSATSSDPAHPALAPLEIELLVAEGEIETARQRARSALDDRRSTSRREASELLAFLRRAADDPEAAVALYRNLADPSALEELARLVALGCARPLPHLAAVQDDPEHPDRRLESSEATLRDEAFWRQHWPIVEPFGADRYDLDAEEAWAAPERWLAALGARPRLFDSLGVLDDLCQAVRTLDRSHGHWIDENLVGLLTARAAAIVEAALASAPGATLPWAEPENRPAIRLLASRAESLATHGRGAEAARLLERLMALDPSDPEGLRGDLVCLQLSLGENEAALSWAEGCDDDDLPEVHYGRVLALLRLERRAEARAALDRALAVQPHLPAYLLDPEAEPSLDLRTGHDHGEGACLDCDDCDGECGCHGASGSPEEAWMLAQSLRELWATPPDALAWLASVVGS